MKKIFIALSVLAALIFSVAPSQALVGMPDDAPGCDAVWWFLTDMEYPQSGVNTLVVFTEVNKKADTATTPAVVYEWTSWDIDSSSVADGDLIGTQGDVFATDGYSLVMEMSNADRTAHEIDLDGDGENDHWAGYILFTKVGDNLNNVVGQTLLVNLPQGLASMCNVHMKEFNANVANPVMTDGNNFELFSANALKAAKDLQIGAQYAPPDTFALYPRYMQVDSNSDLGTSMLIVWKSQLDPDLSIHVDWWNAKEDNLSTNIPLPHELNFINVRDYIPNGLDFDDPNWKEGWIEFIVDGAALNGDEEWLAWTWHAAYGPAAESWSVLAPVARDAYID